MAPKQTVIQQIRHKKFPTKISPTANRYMALDRRFQFRPLKPFYRFFCDHGLLIGESFMIFADPGQIIPIIYHDTTRLRYAIFRLVSICMNRPNKRAIIQMKARHRITGLAIMMLGIQTDNTPPMLPMSFSRGIGVKLARFTKPFHQSRESATRSQNCESAAAREADAEPLS